MGTMVKRLLCFVLQAVAVTTDPDAHSRCESQAAVLGDEGLEQGPPVTGVNGGLSQAAHPKNMTTAQDGHGQGATATCSASNPKAPKMVTSSACQNGGCKSSPSSDRSSSMTGLKIFLLLTLLSSLIGRHTVWLNVSILYQV